MLVIAIFGIFKLRASKQSTVPDSRIRASKQSIVPDSKIRTSKQCTVSVSWDAATDELIPNCD